MATTDLLSDDEAREILGIGDTDASKADTLASYVTAVSQRIVDSCGPVVAAGTIVESFDGGCSSVWLKKWPVMSVSSVIEYDSTVAGTLTAESVSSQPGAGYWIDLASGELTRRDGGADRRFPSGRGNVVVTYTPGRCADTESVPEKFKTGAGIMLKNMWRTMERGAGRSGEYDVPQAAFPTFAVPNAVKQLLAKEWQTGSGTGD